MARSKVIAVMYILIVKKSGKISLLDIINTDEGAIKSTRIFTVTIMNWDIEFLPISLKVWISSVLKPLDIAEIDAIEKDKPIMKIKIP